MERNDNEKTKRNETERTLAGETHEKKERFTSNYLISCCCGMVKCDCRKIIETKQVDRARVNSHVYSRVRVVVP